MQKTGDRNRVADDYRLYRLLHDAPNDVMTALQFRETLMGHVLLWGNAYAEIVRSEVGDITALWPFTPDRVTPRWTSDERLVYDVRTNAETITLSRRNILHIAGLGFDGLVGYSVIAMARKSLGLGMALETFGARYFGQGTHPGVIVSHPAQLSAQAHDNLKRSLTETYSGLGNAHRLLLLEEGMKLEKLGIPPNDSQFLESRQFSIAEVARWFNLPVHKLKELSRSTNNNIEHQGIEYYVDAILPWLVRLEQAYNAQLLSDGDRGAYGRGRLYFKHNAAAILRGDAASRADFYTKMFNIGAFSPNDIRRLEDLDPVPNGDIHLVPLNMTTMENAGKPQPAPSPARLPAPDETPDEAAPARRNGNGNGNGSGTPARRGEE